MDEKSLRALVREEVEAVLDEESHIDSHLKFRRLVEHRVGQPLDEFSYDITFQAWNDALVESAGQGIDEETLEYYINEAVEKILNS